MSESFHSRYLALVELIERDYPVARWRAHGVDLWPFARMDLHADMYWQSLGKLRPAQPSGVRRTLGALATPARNVWRSRKDFSNLVLRPRPAHAIVLGDGVSLDCIDGRWQDRFAEPVIDALEQHGLNTLLMQAGALGRLPWKRPTLAANTVGARGALLAGLSDTDQAQLPGYEKVLELLQRHGVSAPSLDARKLVKSASVTAATASVFQSLLRRVRPKLAFVVTYYSGLAPAFLLACRREGILSIDLQHCPQEGAHSAYRWKALPEAGYATLPAVFWNWTEREAEDIRAWAGTSPFRWHSSVHGGHPQLAQYLDDASAVAKKWDARFNDVNPNARFEREILVALQPLGGYRTQWETLTRQIEQSPRTWRWWIRRHPAASASQDDEYRRLIELRRENVVIDGVSSMPLPALLRHMSAVVSISSGVAVECEAFGVPSLFLAPEARARFERLIARGGARIVESEHVLAEIARLPPVNRHGVRQPSLDATLSTLEQMAGAYAERCGRVHLQHVRGPMQSASSVE